MALFTSIHPRCLIVLFSLTKLLLVTQFIRTKNHRSYTEQGRPRDGQIIKYGAVQAYFSLDCFIMAFTTQKFDNDYWSALCWNHECLLTNYRNARWVRMNEQPQNCFNSHHILTQGGCLRCIRNDRGNHTSVRKSDRTYAFSGKCIRTESKSSGNYRTKIHFTLKTLEHLSTALNCCLS